MSLLKISAQRLTVLSAFVLVLTAACAGNTDDGDGRQSDDQSGGVGATPGSGGEGNGGGGATGSGGKAPGAGGEEAASGGADAAGGASGGVGGSGGEACVSTTCEAEGKNCDSIDDGCGETLDCGTCDEGSACGSATPNVCGCEGSELISTGQQHARAARSGTFTGTDQDYIDLYSLSCVEDVDCMAPCTAAGGNEDFCGAGLCQPSDTNYCLPPVKWTRMEKLLFEGTSLDDTARMNMSTFNGPFQDNLIVHEFSFDVPDDAIIEGITVSFHRATNTEGAGADKAVRIVKGGAVGDVDRGRPTIWPKDLQAADYGGETDLWGEEWTPADINSPDFGASLTALPVDGGEAFVDIVYAEVHYRLECE